MAIKTKALLLFAALSATTALAKPSAGNWAVYPLVDYTYENVVDAADRTYFLSGGTLFSRSHDDDEIYFYTKANKLSDTSIKGIYYNDADGFLLLAYDNGNIDLVFDNGRTANLPDIKDAILTSTHGIRNACFHDKKIYLATDFGFAIYDSERLEVTDSGIYNIAVDNIFPVGDRLVLVSGGKLYSSPLEGRHSKFDSFTQLSGNFQAQSSVLLSSGTIAFADNSGIIKTAVPDFALNIVAVTATAYTAADKKIRPAAQGGAFARAADKYVFISPDGTVSTTAIPEGAAGKTAYSFTGPQSVWITTTAGAARYRLDGDSPAITTAEFRPEAFTVAEAAHFTWSPDGNRLYVRNAGPAQYYTSSDYDNYDGIQTVNIFTPDDNTIRDVTVMEAEPINSAMAARQQRTDWKGIVGGATRLAEDPDDSSIWYQGTNSTAFFVMRGNEVLTYFDHNNSYDDWDTPRGYDLNIDPAGNLWLGLGHRGAPAPTYLVLPADKRRGDLKAVKHSDWIRVVLPDYWTSREMNVLFCRHSNLRFFTQGEYNNIMVMDNNGTPHDFSDDRLRLHQEFFDTDGREIESARSPYMVEDRKGHVWMPTVQGPIVIEKPADAMGDVLTFRRPIVARNDGTGLGDYLLDGVKVVGIAVDPTDRKWLATETDGVYLVSPDGTEIMEHFNASNSPLPNFVYDVACHPHSNKVFFGTKDGFYSYDSDSSPAAGDYSDIYAYPNPVRPEYTGWITVKGLMDGSLVKIADMAGNVFFQGRSEGGMIRWDGCNSAGERVRTGAYLVFASQNGDSGGSSGAVAKIMVIN